MTYRHKRDPCTKEARDIIENILRANTTNYDLTETSDVESRKTVHFENGPNVLVSDVDREKNNLDEIEKYQPCQDVDFEALDVKECFEKKKKRRNYIEFRADYVKIQERG
jgi:hypothetical protein